MLKTYRALSMAAALAEVKKDLGADAVIVNTRTLRSGGVLGLGARNVIEITATAGSPRNRSVGESQSRSASNTATLPRRTAAATIGVVMTPASPSAEARTRGVDARAAASMGAASSPPRVQARPAALVEPRAGAFVPTSPRSLQAALADARAERSTEPMQNVRSRPESAGAGSVVSPTGSRASVVTSPSAPAPAVIPAHLHDAGTGVALLDPPSPAALGVLEAALPEPAPTARIATPVRVAPVDDSARVAIEEELASIKRLVAQVLQTSRQTAVRVQAGGGVGGAAGGGGGGVGVSTEPIMAMSVRLLDAQLAPELTDVLLGKVRDELSPGELSDEGTVREAVLRHLASAIPIAPDSTLRRSDSGRPLTLALIGPTGVGKTTTIAKLAAALKLRHAKKVGLVTSDTYRIAAVEQLRTYANIIGLPLKVALTPEDMSASCDALSDCDIILVDTAGRSQHDAARIDELRRQRDAAQPHQTHLVLAAGASESVLLRAAERFKPLGPDRLLITKLDEAVTFGPIVNVASRIGLGLSFVTTGQEVPDHIERARAERLARLVVDGGSVR